MQLRRTFFTALTAYAALACASPSAWAAQVTCGQASQGDAVLAGDCTGDLVMHGGRLNLAGHTVHGTIVCGADECEVFSSPRGAVVAGFGVALSNGIVAGEDAATSTGDLIVDGVTVRGFGTGLAARNVVVTNSAIVGNLSRGVDALETIEAVSVVVRRNGEDGLYARMGSVAIDGSEITANGGSGVRALTGVIAVGSTLSDNARDGVENYSNPALLVDSHVRRNGRHGVRSDDADCDPTDILELRHSESAGNGTAEGCSVEWPCADLVACASPVVDDRSVCDSSLHMGDTLPGVAWGVCEGDGF